MKLKNIALAIALLLSTSVYAQQGKLHITAQVSDDAIQLNWIYLDYDSFLEEVKAGYTVVRSASNSQPSMTKEVICADKAFFEANEEEGIMAAVGELLYNGKFDFPPSESLDPAQMRYSYIGYEASIRPAVAAAVGLGYVDDAVQPGQVYTYTVTSKHTGQSASITVSLDSGTTLSPPGTYPKFDFPNGQSLSTMVALADPTIPDLIAVTARAYEDSLVLRWGPSTYGLWLAGMRDGYEVYRSDGAGDMILLKTVYPWSREQIDESISHDTMAMFAASSVLSKGIPQGSETLDFFERSTAAENYFGFTLMAADQSPLAADVLGLRYVDTSVEPGKFYNYEIRTKSLTTPLLYGDIIVENTRVIPDKPSGFWARSGEKAITLLWDKSPNNNFTSYEVSASVDSTDFEPLHDAPLLFIKTDVDPSSRYSFTDSLGDGIDKKYYQLRGKDGFGEWSAVATAVGYKVDRTLPAAVTNFEGEYDVDTKIISMTWDASISDDVIGYQIYSADSPNDDFYALSLELGPDSTAYTWDISSLNRESGFFFKVASIDKNYNLSYSLPLYVGVPDHIPPLPPTEVEGRIDSTGKVEVIWKNSESTDVTGYYIYWSDSRSEEFLSVNSKPLDDNYITWDIIDTSLNEYLFVCIRAQDANYNKSDVSEVIMLDRPDYVPPVKPFVEFIEMDNGSLDIFWQPSLSIDVEGQIIYYRQLQAQDTSWVVLDTLPALLSNYQYAPGVYGKDIGFALQAYDEAGNMSGYSNMYKVNVPFPSDLYQLDLDEAKGSGRSSSVSLRWEVDDRLIIDSLEYSIEIFRSTGTQEPLPYTVVSPAQDSFTDTEVSPDVLYNYAVRIRYSNGWQGAISKVASVLLSKSTN